MWIFGWASPVRKRFALQLLNGSNTSKRKSLMDHGWLLAPGRREVVYPALFAAVKQIVRANAIDDEKRVQIKSWLKQNGDAALCLLSLTVGAIE